MSASVFIVAVEPSGDQLGAALITSIKAIKPDVFISGIGGEAMAQQGVESQMDISGLSVLGFAEAVRVYRLVIKKVDQTTALVMRENPQAVVLIDSWGFMIRVAKALKAAGYKGQIVKYVAPQVWAMREGRAKILAKHVDHLLCLHSFDPPFFTQHGLDVTHVGNPILDVDYTSGNEAVLREKYNLSRVKKTIGVFFGSRANEVERLSDTLLGAMDILHSSDDNLEFIAPVASSIEPLIRDKIRQANIDGKLNLVNQRDLMDSFAAINVALACSGTITTQLAAAGVPTVVAYKLSPITYHAAKYIFKPNYISLVNIAADRALMPEFVQAEASANNLAQAADMYLKDEALSASRSSELKVQTGLMKAKGGSASVRAAIALIDLIAA